MYFFSKFFPLGFYGVLTRHGHVRMGAQGGVLGNHGPDPAAGPLVGAPSQTLAGSVAYK